MTFKQLVWSFDTVATAIVFLVLFLNLPPRLPNAVDKDIYGVGIAVLAIVFAVFVAALTLMVSAGDDEFIAFLEENGTYSAVLKAFRHTARALLLSLIFSITLYAITAFWIDKHFATQSRWWLIGFVVLFVYSLIATYMVTEDCLNYASHRSQHIQLEKNKKKNC